MEGIKATVTASIEAGHVSLDTGYQQCIVRETLLSVRTYKTKNRNQLSPELTKEKKINERILSSKEYEKVNEAELEDGDTQVEVLESNVKPAKPVDKDEELDVMHEAWINAKKVIEQE